ncbi:hypothetical protein EJ076_15800 [Mesorhizobium sp. M7D.F.Ca.US.005.01.1.1]|uniref:hypothetical protein n=1 Tax=Mesorhizobium sp. M7D.F.Ca.US.005.01.1.1 TaxID=2493678 RepID=UPI000F762920|nr:hypothetical protein [Mesorhizobium sp. M7D.F.Ca.US.005.01.1.1]AZO42448.1 hypothetical protein EJ076_15800 [Mesorhizobium sp. M7D.F.Ca.US.005.01.1.1]
MISEAEFTRDISAEFERLGWVPEDPNRFASMLNFKPDLVLRKGDQHTVVEIRKQGQTTGRRIADMRRMVERHPNFQFEVRFLAPSASSPHAEIASSSVRRRIDLASELVERGDLGEGIAVAWIAIETSLRVMLNNQKEGPSVSDPSRLIRTAFEAGKISQAQLFQLVAALNVRSQIVHGFDAAIPSGLARQIVGIAREIADQAGVN